MVGKLALDELVLANLDWAKDQWPTPFKLFTLKHFNNILMAVFGFFRIPVKLILRQVHTWSLILTPFDIKIAFQRKVCTQSSNHLVPLPLVDHQPHCSPNSDPL